MAARLTDRQKALRLIPEKQFQRDIQKLLDIHGWTSYHAADNIPRGGWIANIRPGFPDLTAVRAGRLIFAELKTETGRVSPAQLDWHEQLRAAGVEVFIWRPSDMEEILKVLVQHW